MIVVAGCASTKITSRNPKQGIIKAFVELRDVNYPGSKYNLQYDAGIDRLKGTYFQAVYGETYDVFPVH